MNEEGIINKTVEYISNTVETIDEALSVPSTTKSYYKPINKDELMKQCNKKQDTTRFNRIMKELKSYTFVTTTEDVVKDIEKKQKDKPGTIKSMKHFVKNVYSYVRSYFSNVPLDELEKENHEENEDIYKARRKLEEEKAMDSNAPISDRIAAGVDVVLDGTMEINTKFLKENEKALEKMEKHEKKIRKGYILSFLDSSWKLIIYVPKYILSILKHAEETAKEKMHKSEKTFAKDHAMNSEAPVTNRLSSGIHALIHESKQSEAIHKQEYHADQIESAKEETLDVIEN